MMGGETFSIPSVPAFEMSLSLYVVENYPDGKMLFGLKSKMIAYLLVLT